jgi:acyl-CoA thioesterase-1
MRALGTRGRLRKSFRLLPWACVAGFSLVFASVASAAALSPSCALPDSLLSLTGRLEHTLDRLKTDKLLHIVAIGSSSTAGAGASTPQHTYPALLEGELEERFPHLDVEVDNLGINGEVASSTIARMRTEVAVRDPDLVIWQLGTNDAVNGVSSDSFRTQVLQTIDWLQAQDVDIILMNPQLFPRVEKSQTYAAFVEDLGELAMEENVPVLNRFAAMQHWNRLPDGVRQSILWQDNFHMNDQGYACVAEMLAESIYRRSAVNPSLNVSLGSPARQISASTPGDEAAEGAPSQ